MLWQLTGCGGQGGILRSTTMILSLGDRKYGGAIVETGSTDSKRRFSVENHDFGL